MALAIALVLALIALLGAPWLLLLLDAPLWVPLAFDLLAIASALLVALARWALQRSKARAIERAVAPAKPSQAPARSDLAAELEDIRRELDAAITSIARSRLGGGGRGALLALPWYAIVGSPGAGKSMLLRASGLSFPTTPQGSTPASDGRHAPARPIGATRRCDVWLGNEAVLLDTAGKWSTADDDAEWCVFLERLRRHRGERALDGILLAVAVDELLSATEAERSALARRLRARVESVSARLGVAVPVYVMVTKCDRLVGFAESFAGLDKRGRARPWGFTLDGGATGSIEEQVQGELATMTQQLRARIASVLVAERRVESRAWIVELPAHFASVADPLTSLLSQVFVASVYGETPALRGVYFTSATQEGRPMDRLLSTSLRAAGIDAPPIPEPTLEPRSYFVHQVLTRVVFADAETAAPSTRAKRRRAIVHTTLGAGLALAASVLALGTAFSWRANRRSIDDVARALATLPSAPELATPESFDALAASLHGLRRLALDGPPLHMRFGLYDGGRVGRVARARYLSALRDHVLAPLLETEATELETWGAAYEADLDREPSEPERARAVALLERQLRLGAPAEPAEPPLDARGSTRFAQGLAEAWCGALGRSVDDCRAHAALLVAMTNAADRPRVERRASAVRVARLGLGRVRADRAAIDALIAATAGRGYDLTLAGMVGTTGQALTSDAHVRGAFTRRGWEEVVRAHIDTGDDEDDTAWVLGRRSTRATLASRDALRRAYFAAYVEEWRGFLSSVRVAPAVDATEALALLEDLTRGTPTPLGRLLVAVDENARLDGASASPSEGGPSTLLESLTTHLASARPEAATPTPAPTSSPGDASSIVRALAPFTHFAVAGDGAPNDAPLGIDVYDDELALLRDALATYRDDPSAAPALEARLVAARRRVDGLVTEQAPGARDFFERVLRPPVEAAALTSSRAMASAVATRFCAAVVTPFDASIAGRYPFAPHGDDAALGEVAAFYRPTGTLWSYYDASLGAIAPRAGSRFTLARQLEQSGASPYGSELPAFLDRSQAITSGLFPPGNTEPRIELDVRIHPTAGAALVRFSVGGATIDYRNGPETWSRIVWPGATPTAGARIEVESARGLSERITEDGEWGLFRLVEAAARVEARTGERTRTAHWHLPGHDVDVVVDLRPVRTECALFGDGARSRVLAPLRASGVAAPRHIARGGSGCAP